MDFSTCPLPHEYYFAIHMLLTLTQVLKMKPDPKKLINEAMQLEPASRALVAETLLESLDIGADFALSEEWEAEIRRRCETIDKGAIDLVQGHHVLDNLRRKYD